MPDIEDIVQSVRQFGMAIYCGLPVSHWAYAFMVNTRDAGICVGPCLDVFHEQTRGRYA